MSKSKFEQSLESGAHRRLINLVGNWKGGTKIWFEKDVLADESSMEASITSVMSSRFISYNYFRNLDGKSFEGEMIIGFDIPYQQFTASWVDTFHMGTQIMLSKGEATENGFSILGSYGSPEYGEQLWGWRTELEILSDEEIVFTAYNISPEGEEAKATETIYRKVSHS